SALNRQLSYEESVGFLARFLVSYDWMVDESFPEGGKGKNKRRVGYRTSERRVEETVNAAKFLADQRHDLGSRRLVLSAQGITVPQYLNCVKQILSFADSGDVLGL